MAAAARCDAHVDQHPGVHRAQQFGDALGARRAVPERDQWHRPAVLGGWLGGNVAAFVYFALLSKFEKDQGYQFSSSTIVVVGLMLAALAVAVAIFARAAARREMTDATAS